MTAKTVAVMRIDRPSRMKNRMTSAPIRGMYVIQLRMLSICSSALRFGEEIHDGDEHDARAHHQGIVLNEAALHAAESARCAAAGVGHAVDQAVDDVLVEQVRSVAERKNRDVPRQVDQ